MRWFRWPRSNLFAAGEWGTGAADEPRPIFVALKEDRSGNCAQMDLSTGMFCIRSLS